MRLYKCRKSRLFANSLYYLANLSDSCCHFAESPLYQSKSMHFIKTINGLVSIVFVDFGARTSIKFK